MHSFKVERFHFPEFEGKIVHKVCSTYGLAKEVEWSTRLFVIDMIEEGEEGIGVMLKIDHISPAFEGEIIFIEAIFESLVGNEVICSFTAKVDDRIVAKGETGQRILTHDKLKQIFSNL